MLAIEIDGISHGYKYDQDEERDKRLGQLGVKVLRFTDSSVKHNLNGVLDEIDYWIKENFPNSGESPTPSARRVHPSREGNFASPGSAGEYNFMKRVFIIHGWGGAGGEGWQAWLKIELEKKGFKVFAPDMPDTENPKIETWVPVLAKLVDKCDEETFFVGHSIGCQTILRYLEELPAEAKAGGAVFVAGWFNLKGLSFQEEEIAMPWLRLPIDFEKVKAKTKKFFALFSSNDPFVPVEDEKLFKEKLGAETLILKNKEHFTGEDGINKLPIVSEKILEFSKN